MYLPIARSDHCHERHIATLPEDATVEISAVLEGFIFTGTTPSKSTEIIAFIMDREYAPARANFATIRLPWRLSNIKRSSADAVFRLACSQRETTKGSLAQKLVVDEKRYTARRKIMRNPCQGS